MPERSFQHHFISKTVISVALRVNPRTRSFVQCLGSVSFGARSTIFCDESCCALQLLSYFSARFFLSTTCINTCAFIMLHFLAKILLFDGEQKLKLFCDILSVS